MNEETVIPPMTHELGRNWKQPDRGEILVDDTHAVMTKATFDKLANYSFSAPSGVYEGKMWRSSITSQTDTGVTQYNYLNWYDTLSAVLCRVVSREIIIV